ncbi:MAG: aspartate aminotransferase family protein [SAR86 cluster bacterium]|uniref:Acetylornithine aminotransferase n=1 Tax=SAR86 cluster bacterium TaxID=2030880 RepID=A0A2A5C6X0_9GAMM|nr:MAG: aspartate aminotransferase family protein [SAR86 cluster bacterium]
MPTYKRYPIAFDHGEGVWLYDTAGNKYLDAISGIAVCPLGHKHPAFTQALIEQSQKLIHTSNLYSIPLQEELATKLCQDSDMQQIFFANSGTEANEAAIKVARMYGHNKGISLPQIIVMEGAFHGRSMGSLSATYNTKHQEGFAPLLEGFVRAPLNDVAAIEKCLSENSGIVAIMLEPIQGESGINPCTASYLESVQALCDQHDLLLILDEVQTGNGRTGKYFSFQHSAIQPDILTTAKGMGNGFPMGVCLIGGRAVDVMQPGHHGSTFGGSPLASAAGLAVNKAIHDENLMQNAQRQGDKIRQALQDNLADITAVKEVRGLGLMLGIELSIPCGELVNLARDKGLLITVQMDKVIRLLPPLIINDSESQLIIDTLTQLIREFCHER